MKETIGQRVKQIRKLHGLTQLELGRFVLTDRSHLSNVEKGKTRPSKRLLRLISLQLGVAEAWLEEGVDAMGKTGRQEMTDKEERKSRQD